jgi:hypothetical protein
MSITPQVRETLDRQGIHETSVNKDGYRVEDGPDDSAVVRWGRGEPFRGAPISHRGDDLSRCGRALDGAGFNVVPKEFEDADVLQQLPLGEPAKKPQVREVGLPGCLQKHL